MPLSEVGRVPTALAVVQTGMACGPMEALIAADAALRRDLVTKQDLERRCGGGAWDRLARRCWSRFSTLADGAGPVPG